MLGSRSARDGSADASSCVRAAKLTLPWDSPWRPALVQGEAFGKRKAPLGRRGLERVTGAGSLGTRMAAAQDG